MSLTRRRFIERVATAVGVAGSAAVCDLQSSSGHDVPFLGRFSICNETFADWPFEKAFALAAECGYSGIEIAPFTISDYVTDVSPQRRRAIRQQAQQAGLEIVGLHWLLARTTGFHLTSPEIGIRKKTASYLGALAQFCADLGGKLLVFGSPKQRNLVEGVGREQGLRFAAEVIREALPVLEQADVRLAIEPLSPGTTNFLRTAAEAVELIETVDSPRCRLILDCLAMTNESKPPADLIREFRSHLIHFHANDPNGMGPGFGSLDFVTLFRALREIDYPGWVSVEVFNTKPGPERLARESIEYMRKCIAR